MTQTLRQNQAAIVKQPFVSCNTCEGDLFYLGQTHLKYKNPLTVQQGFGLLMMIQAIVFINNLSNKDFRNYVRLPCHSTNLPQRKFWLKDQDLRSINKFRFFSSSIYFSKGAEFSG